MTEKRSNGGLLVGARSLGLAELVCRKLVGGVRAVDGALLLAADPAWAGAINTVLVKSGVRVNELRRAEETWTVEPTSPQADFVRDSSTFHHLLVSSTS